MKLNPLSDIMSVLFPTRCHVCGEVIPASLQPAVCPACMDKIPHTFHFANDMNTVYTALTGNSNVRRAGSWMQYDPAADSARLIHDFKYNGYSKLALHLGRTMAKDILPTGFFSGIDYIVPVPLHFTKLMRRGYNQSQILALGISSVTDTPVINNLKAVRSHRTQTALTHEQRASNVKGIFRFNPKGIESDATILIVDDVCTTGATLLSAADAITDAMPDAELVALTLASTR